MGIAVAIVLGVIAGVISYLPYVLATKKAKQADPEHNMVGLAAWFFFAVVISFLILFVCIIICVKVARDVALFFALAGVLALIVMVFVFGLIIPKRKK